MVRVRVGAVTGVCARVPGALAGAGWWGAAALATVSRGGAAAAMRGAAAGAANVHRGVSAARDSVTTAVVASPLIERVVDAQLRRVLAPLVAEVLDDVLGRLEAEPERVRALIRGQREGIVSDVVEGLRDGAMAGDARLDRLTRLLRWRSESQGEPGDAAGPR